MSGLDVFEALGADDALSRVPVIFASSHNSPACERAALDKGAADFVAKPLVAPRLVARARAQLRKRQLIEKTKTDHRAAMAALEPRPDAHPRLLFVDDDIVAQHGLRRILDGLGEAHFATSAEAAIRICEEVAPDLIVLDYQIPGVDGFDLCTRLQQVRAARPHLPIALLTRFFDPRTEMQALNCGAADFICKASAPAVLRARIRNLLVAKTRLDRELRAIGAQWRRLGSAQATKLLGSASDAVVSVDSNGTVVLANAAAGRLFDRQHQGLVGRPAALVLGAVAHAIDGGDVGQPMSLQRDSLTSLDVAVTVATAGEGVERVSTLIIGEVGVHDRLVAATQACSAAEAANDSKSTLLSYVVHEIGNPLQGLLGFAELMGLALMASRCAPG